MRRYGWTWFTVLVSILLWKLSKEQLCFPKSRRNGEGDVNTCTYSPDISVFQASNELDCCLWSNVKGFSETPTWRWSISLQKWHTPCKKCNREKFVICHQGLCTGPHDRLAETPEECCGRPGITAYAHFNHPQANTDCHRCQTEKWGDNWSIWSTWSSCSATCGSAGFRKRIRQCNKQPPKLDEHKCLGNSYEVQTCHLQKCQVDDHNHVPDSRAPWGPWSSCHVTCGVGVRTRTKNCPKLDTDGNFSDSFDQNRCIGYTEVSLCELDPCSSTVAPTVVQESYQTIDVAAWSVAGGLLFVVVVGLLTFYCRKRCQEQILSLCLRVGMPKNSDTLPTNRIRGASRRRPPNVPLTDPPVYCSLIEAPGSRGTPSAKYCGSPVSSPDDGYEVPLQCIQSGTNDNESPTSLLAVNHIYEQVQYVLPDLIKNDVYNDDHLGKM